MANYIVDASVVIEYLIAGPYTPNVQAFFNRLTAADRLTVPEFSIDQSQIRAAAVEGVSLIPITTFK